jgi:hypothetical protein
LTNSYLCARKKIHGAGMKFDRSIYSLVQLQGRRWRKFYIATGRSARVLRALEAAKEQVSPACGLRNPLELGSKDRPLRTFPLMPLPQEEEVS